MKFKKMWITLVPFTLLMLVTKIFQQYIEFSNKSFIGNGNLITSYIIIGLVLVLFVILLIMNIADKKTIGVYDYQVNNKSGAVCFLSAIAVAVNGVCALIPVISKGSLSVTIVIDLLFSLLCAVGLFLLSWFHLSGRKPTLFLSIYMLVIPVWCLEQLFNSLVLNSANTVVTADVMYMLVYIFLVGFFFCDVSITSLVNQGNKVKGAMLFGLSLIAVAVTYGVSVITNILFNGFLDEYYVNIIQALVFALFALYAYFNLMEISKNVSNKDEIEIIDDEVRIRALERKFRNKNIHDAQVRREKERQSGNYYITEEENLGITDTLPDEVGDTTLLKEESNSRIDDDFIVTPIPADTETLPYYYQSKEEEEDFSRINDLILEITSGDNDLDRIDNLDNEEN